ncbi:MAG: Maf family protein [Candidatus Cloacimonetes bacterium]|nr:Maf family protein [Candidatus Cloacimonadota bacterium]
MLHKLLGDHKLVLASASPRRKVIFDMLGLKYLVRPAHIDEIVHTHMPSRLVLSHAADKAAAVAADMDPDCIVVAADTIVYEQREVIGKPTSESEAAALLRRLSDNTHVVYTGVCVRRGPVESVGFERTRVTFKQLSEQEIADYIATGEPMDKAGAYGIQGYGSQFVTKLNGCYFNVMGFPVNLFYRLVIQGFYP